MCISVFISYHKVIRRVCTPTQLLHSTLTLLRSILDRIVSARTTLPEDMKPAVTRLSKEIGHYRPLIKFIGTRHPVFPRQKGAPMAPHPCTLDGLLPGGGIGCLSVADFLGKQLPFEVKPYTAPASSPPASNGSDSRYQYVTRPLEPNEVDSVFQLPEQYRYRPLQEGEIDIINGGGIN